MKQILLGLLFMFLIAGLSAQRFTLVNPVEAPVILDMDDKESLKPIELELLNLSSDTLFLQVSLEESVIAEGHRTQFCASGDCESVEKGLSQTLVILPKDTFVYSILTAQSGQTDTEYIYFDSKGITGESELFLQFEDLRGSGSIQDAYIHFAANGRTLPQAPKAATVSAPYPNPADRVAYLDYTLPEGISQSYLRVVNLIGREVKRVALEKTFGTATLLTDQLPSGVYFVYLIGDNEELGTRKLVVSK